MPSEPGPTTVRLALLQYCAGPDIAGNLDASLALFEAACRDGAALVALPEAADRLDCDGARLASGAQPLDSHPFVVAYRRAAREHGVYVLLGSVTALNDDRRPVNRQVLIAPDGTVVAVYDKIHLFDAPFVTGREALESAIYAPGDSARLAATPWGLIGLSICYDLRFPQLFRTLAQAGASVLFVPSAFMQVTGEAHWHVLLRARAIENGCFVLAPAQCGSPYAGRTSYGHSLAVDPWGRVLVDAGEEPGVSLVDIDLREVSSVRARLPSLSHDRSFTLMS